MPFNWFQILPTGATIHVEYRYRSVPGYSFVTCEALDEDYVKRGFCVNEGFRHKFAARVKAEKNQMMEGADIRYVVRTGANWLGPIGHFRRAAPR